MENQRFMFIFKLNANIDLNFWPFLQLCYLYDLESCVCGGKLIKKIVDAQNGNAPKTR